jgi:hypothetical protein
MSADGTHIRLNDGKRNFAYLEPPLAQVPTNRSATNSPVPSDRESRRRLYSTLPIEIRAIDRRFSLLEDTSPFCKIPSRPPSASLEGTLPRSTAIDFKRTLLALPNGKEHLSTE